MKAVFRISEQDYVDGMKLFAKVSPRIVAIRCLVGLGLAAACLFGPDEARGFATGALLGGIAVACFARYLMPVMHRRNYRKYKAIQGEFAVELAEDGIRFLSANSDVKLTWDNVLKWRQNDQWLLLYPMPRMFHMIPTTVASQGFDLQALRERLRRHVGEPV